jgi:transposase
VFFEVGLKNSFCLVLRGVTIILDRASFHRKKKLAVIVERAGVFLLFLPAYSPGFNRIEPRWANMKRALPDLMPKCETLQEAIYTHFGECNS